MATWSTGSSPPTSRRSIIWKATSPAATRDRTLTKPKNPLVVAVDIGTSRIKTAIFDARARILAHSAGHAWQRLKTSPDGGAEIEPRVLRRALRTAFDHTLRSMPEATIAAVGISCFWHGLLGLDRAGRPLTPIYTWADSRCRVQAEALRVRLSEREVHRRTGCMLRSSFWPAKLVWLGETDPDLFKAVCRWVSPVEWLQADLSDGATCGVGMASGTGLLDPASGKWDREMLEVCSIDPGLLGSLDDSGFSTSNKVWRRYPGLREAVWLPPIGDGAASNLGSGATSEGLCAINLGTSSAVRVLSANGPERAPFGLFQYLLDSRRCLVGGASSNCGNLWKWCLDHLGPAGETSDIEAALAKRRRPLHGLTVLPFWTAERAPFWEESLSGVILGINQSSTSLDIIQACVEAAFHRVALILERLEESQGRSLSVVASGGGARSTGALRRLADVLGKPVLPSGEDEASLRGAAVYALERLGLDPPPLRTRSRISPDPAVAAEHARNRSLMLDWERRLGVRV